MKTSGKDNNYNILVVEDDEGVNRLVQKKLDRAGYEVAGAFTGKEGIIWAIANPDGLLLLDYKLSDMNAKEVIEQLLGRKCHVPFIVITGQGDEKIAVEMMILGARDYIVKDGEFIDRLPQVVKRVIKELVLEKEVAGKEKALIQSEERFRQLAENIDQVFWLTDWEEKKLLYVSPSYERIYGRTCQSIYENQLSWLDVIHPDDRGRVRETFARNAELGHYTEAVYRIVRDGGNIRWIRDMAYPVRNASGKVYRFVSLAEDITERKRVEDALDLKNRMLASINDYSQAIAFAPPDQLFATIVTKLKEITGAAEVLINDYDEERSELVCRQSTLSEKSNTWVRKTLGGNLTGYKTPVRKEKYEEMTSSIVGRVGSLHEVTFGAIPASVGKIIEKMFGFRWFVGLALKHEARLVGTILIAGKPGSIEPEKEELLAYASATANVLARRKAEIALAHSEERFRSLIEKSSDAVLVIDRNSIISYISPSFSKVFGRMPSELLDTSAIGFMSKYVHPDDLNEMMKEFAECLKKPETESRMEFRFKHSDETWHHLIAIGKNHLKTAQVEGLVVNIRDTTVRKTMENALRESEERLKEAQAMGKIGDWEFNMETNKITWSDEVYELYERDKSLGTPTPGEESRYYPPEQAAMTREFAKRAIEKGEDFAYDLKVTLPSGRVAHFTATMRPKKDKSGRITRLCGTVQDITERKKMEENLLEREKIYRDLFESSMDGIYLTTPDGTIIEANQSFCDMFEYDKEELMGTNIRNLYVNPEDRDKMLSILEMTDSTPGFGVKMRKKGGAVIHCLVSKSVHRSRTGEIEGYQGILHDITLRTLSEQKIKNEYERAELYNDLMAHDINNFNQGVVSNLELLLVSGNLSGKGKKHASGALGQISNSANLISNLNKLREFNDKNRETRSMAVLPVLQEAIDNMRTQFPDRPLKIKYNPGQIKYKVIGNELLFDVFTNILTNAIKFDRHKKIEIDILVAETDEGLIGFEFIDRGSGVEDRFKKMIFDRLTRLEKSFKGSGLGLTLVKTIVESYGGKIWIEDRVTGDRKKGSKFVLLLQEGE
jgi:PAS domain S-box-containing protein